MKYRVDTHSDVPPSRQLVESILDALAQDEFPPGERLPSVRNMAADALVNPNTVVKAYRELEALGVVKGRNGSGVYVTDSGPKIARKRRGKDTLHAFRRAVKEALDAGHKPGDLLGELGTILDVNAAVNGSRK
jgi:DNA-binding transcriptional regulator YhcF (GntR family)